MIWMRCVDAHGIPELEEDGVYQVEPMACHCVRVFLASGRGLVCAASRFKCE